MILLRHRLYSRTPWWGIGGTAEWLFFHQIPSDHATLPRGASGQHGLKKKDSSMALMKRDHRLTCPAALQLLYPYPRIGPALPPSDSTQELYKETLFLSLRQPLPLPNVLCDVFPDARRQPRLKRGTTSKIRLLSCHYQNKCPGTYTWSRSRVLWVPTSCSVVEIHYSVAFGKQEPLSCSSPPQEHVPGSSSFDGRGNKRPKPSQYP